MKLLTRLWHWTVEVAISLDQLVGLIVAMPFYVIMARGQCPNADETISSHVGRAAIAGEQWALDLEPIIDFIFGKGHCRHAVEIGRIITPTRVINT